LLEILPRGPNKVDRLHRILCQMWHVDKPFPR
jgi:hypothetical protein